MAEEIQFFIAVSGRNLKFELDDLQVGPAQ